MKKTTATLLVPLVASTALVGCGSKTTSSSTGAATGTSTATSAATGTTAATMASDCPTSNTRSFAKTRFVADVGLAAGTFHRYIHKPYQAGSFAKGADKRVSTIAKGAAVAALDAKLIDNAYKNVQASPALCKVLIVPMGQLKASLSSLKGQVATGNLASVATIESLVRSVESRSASSGATITENDSEAAAQAAAKQG